MNTYPSKNANQLKKINSWNLEGFMKWELKIQTHLKLLKLDLPKALCLLVYFSLVHCKTLNSTLCCSDPIYFSSPFISLSLGIIN